MRFRKIAVTIATALALVACGNSQTQNTSSSSTSSEADKTTEITFWEGLSGNNEKELKHLADEFNKSQDQYKVNVQGQGTYQTLGQKIIAAGVSKKLPTISQATASDDVDWYDKGLTKPWDDLLTDQLKKAPYPAFMDATSFKGKQVAYPFSKSTRVMYVNTDLLAKYDVPVPKTWDDIKALGEKMKANGDEAKAMILEAAPAMEVETMARQNGSEWVSEDLKTVDMSSDKAIAGFQFILNGKKDGWLDIAKTGTYPDGDFTHGKYALYIGSSSSLSYLTEPAKENGVHFTAVEIPTFNTDKKLTLLAGNDIVLFKSATEDQQKGAVAFLEFLTQPEQVAEWAKVSGYVPLTKEGAETKTFKDYADKNTQVKASVKELDYAIESPLYVGSNTFWSSYPTTQSNILIKGKDVKAEFKALEDKIKKVIEENN